MAVCKGRCSIHSWPLYLSATAVQIQREEAAAATAPLPVPDVAAPDLESTCTIMPNWLKVEDGTKQIDFRIDTFSLIHPQGCIFIFLTIWLCVFIIFTWLNIISLMTITGFLCLCVCVGGGCANSVRMLKKVSMFQNRRFSRSTLLRYEKTTKMETIGKTADRDSVWRFQNRIFGWQKWKHFVGGNYAGNHNIFPMKSHQPWCQEQALPLCSIHRNIWSCFLPPLFFLSTFCK